MRPTSRSTDGRCNRLTAEAVGLVGPVGLVETGEVICLEETDGELGGAGIAVWLGLAGRLFGLTKGITGGAIDTGAVRGGDGRVGCP